MINGISGYSQGLYGANLSASVQKVNPDEQIKAGRRSSPSECETCKNRKYQDGSDENVSFKAAAHIDPNAAASAVMGHEQEHVSNAYTKAAKDGGEVVNVSVSIHTAVCPECGRTYVSGGTTSSVIKYPKGGNDNSSNEGDAPARNGEEEDFNI